MTQCWCWKVLVVFSGCNIFNDYKQNTLFSYQNQVYFNSGQVWGEVTGGTYSPPPPEMTCGILIQLVTNYSMWFIGVKIKHDHMRQGWRIYVKNHKNVFLARHVTSQFRHSLVVHPLIRKILDPPSLPSVLQKIRKNISFILVFTWYKVSAFKIRSHLNPELSQEIIALALFSH